MSFGPGTGAGKTSLMLAILQLAPYSGEIYIDEQPLTNLNEQACGRIWVEGAPGSNG